MAYYAVLAARVPPRASGWTTWPAPTSPLGHHPDRLLVPASRSRPARWPRAAARRRHGARPAGPGLTTRGSYVLLGDAELDEGSNHEAIAFAGATGLEG